MPSQLKQIQSYKKMYGLIGLFLTAYIIYAGYYIHRYIQLEALHIFAIVAFVAISKIDTNKKTNVPLLLCSGLLLIAYYKFQATSFLYLSLIILIIETMNAYIGRMNLNAYILLLICSPIYTFVSTVIGFPLRLQLSKIAGYLLSFIVKDIVIVGNMLRIDGNDFAIDQACAGLNMLAAAAIFTLLLIEVNRKKANSEIPFISYLFLYGMMLLFNIFSNIFRIFILTLFKVFPENNWHEYIGIICFICYTLIPMYLLIPKIFKHFGKVKEVKKHESTTQWPAYSLFISIIIFGFYTITNMTSIKAATASNVTLHYTALKNYDTITVEESVVKYSDTTHLVYVKPMKAFYSSEHNPLFCWTGCGYLMKEFEERKIKTHTIYFGKMYKGKNEIYTAWYYTDGNKITNSQWQWRWNALNEKKNYYLINISANSENELNKVLDGMVE
jgi:exosortase N